MQIPVNWLKAMMLFCGKEDIRKYLNGVAIQGDRMIATDGHRLTVCKLDSDSGLNVIIPHEVINAAILLNAKTTKDKFRKGSLLAQADKMIEVTGEKIGDVCYQSLLGVYPDYTRVIPAKFKCGNDAITINSAYIADYYKMSKYVGNFGMITMLAKDKDSIVVVHVHGANNFFSLVMPMRADNAVLFPTWLDQYKLPI